MDPARFPAGLGRTKNNLGTAYANLPTGDRGDNLRRAIGCYEVALRIRTERDFPQDWAGTQNDLGSAYWNLPTGDRSDNLRRAIACYEAALRVWTERDFPQAWAGTQNNLGSRLLRTCRPATAATICGARSPATRRHCGCGPSAISRQDWARTQNNLGIAYANLPTGDRATNLRRAIACYEAALRVWTEARFPAKLGRDPEQPRPRLCEPADRRPWR